jgi:hypothetical protein
MTPMLGKKESIKTVLGTLVVFSPLIIFVGLVFYGGIPQLLDQQYSANVAYTFNFDDAPKNATHYTYFYYYYIGSTGISDYRHQSYWTDEHAYELAPLTIKLDDLRHDGILRIEYTYFQKVDSTKNGVAYSTLVALFSGVKEVEINPWGKT